MVKILDCPSNWALVRLGVWPETEGHSRFAAILGKLGTQARYPLVNQHNELENHHAINRKNHYFYGHFPVRFLYVYQRLPPFPRSTGPIQQPQAHLTSSLSKTGRWPFKHLTRLWASCWEIYWIYSHDESMVLLYMVTWIPSIYPSHVSIYTSIMDPMD